MTRVLCTNHSGHITQVPPLDSQAVTLNAPPPWSNPDRPQVIPLAVFAAQRDRFDVLLRGFNNPESAKFAIFKALPLDANGWSFHRTRIEHVKNVDRGMIYRLEKT